MLILQTSAIMACVAAGFATGEGVARIAGALGAKPFGSATTASYVGAYMAAMLGLTGLLVAAVTPALVP